MEGNQDSTVKTLVDVLSASLQNLSEKINSINPILSNVNSNLDKEIAEINKILFDTQSISKLLDTSVGDFYKRTDDIIENIKLIKLKLENIEKVDSSVEQYMVDINNNIINLNTILSGVNNTHNSIIKEVESLRKDIDPVATLSNWLTKPIGIIAFIISLILASMTIINGFNSVLDFFSTTKQNTTPLYDNTQLHKDSQR